MNSVVNRVTRPYPFAFVALLLLACRIQLQVPAWVCILASSISAWLVVQLDNRDRHQSDLGLDASEKAQLIKGLRGTARAVFIIAVPVSTIAWILLTSSKLASQLAGGLFLFLWTYMLSVSVSLYLASVKTEREKDGFRDYFQNR
jgi:hypothetical protein